MAKFAKRPVVVDAEQFRLGEPLPRGVMRNDCRFAPKTGFYVITIHLEQAYLDDGDWVIAESDGKHYYPCKPEEFERIYEPAKEK